MNSFINVLLLVFTLPTMLLSIYVGFDLPVEFLRTTTAQLPYLDYGFLGLGLILLVISLRRSIRRWMGVRMTKQKSKYKWNSTVSAQRKIRVVVYTILESAVMASLGLAYYYLTPLSLIHI